jgi:hypothetical protein
MKSLFLFAALTLGLAPGFAAPRRASYPVQRLYFQRSATQLHLRAFLSGDQNRTYLLKVRGGQHLKISVEGEKPYGMVPLLFVTPPRGQYDGEKTATYETQRTQAGDYRIVIGHNLMASNERSGYFVLKVLAR